MVYVHIGIVLILPESVSQSLYCRRHIRRQYRNLPLIQGVSAHYQCETYTMCYVFPILSPFLFIQSLYASFLKFIGFFIYLYTINSTYVMQLTISSKNFYQFLYFFSWQRTVGYRESPALLVSNHYNTALLQLLYRLWNHPSVKTLNTSWTCSAADGR